MGTPLRHRDIVIRGQVFPTIRAAAEHFGLTYQAVKWALVHGRLDRVGTGSRPKEPMQIRVRGMVFRDARAAAAHFGITPKAVLAAVQHGRQDRLGLPPRRDAAARPFSAFGCTWPSRSAACRDLGLSVGFLWHLENVGGRAARETFLRAIMAYKARGRTGRRLTAVPPAGIDTGSQSGRGGAPHARGEAWRPDRAA